MERAQQSIPESGSVASDREASIPRKVEVLSSAFNKVISNSEDLLKAAANYSAEGLAGARDRLKENLEQAKAGMAEAQSFLKDKTGRASDVTEQYVITNPWKALAIVGSIGVVVGLLLRRRR